MVIVQPQTVVPWHHSGFRLFWRWRSRRRSGRKPKDRALIESIRRMWQANPTWGSPRIRAELANLGLHVSAATVRKYRPKGERRPPSQTWRAFLDHHTKQLIAVDFFTVPTVIFRVLLCSWCWRMSSAATRRRSGLLGGTGSRARLPRNPSDGWAVCWREPSRTVGCCAPTDRSRPLSETHCLRRSSASKGSMRMP